MYPLACFGVVLGYLILVDLIDLEYHVTLFHGQQHLVHCPRTGEGPLLILAIRTCFSGRGVDGCSTQAKYEIIITSVGVERMIQPL